MRQAETGGQPVFLMFALIGLCFAAASVGCALLGWFVDEE